MNVKYWNIDAFYTFSWLYSHTKSSFFCSHKHVLINVLSVNFLHHIVTNIYVVFFPLIWIVYVALNKLKGKKCNVLWTHCLSFRLLFSIYFFKFYSRSNKLTSSVSSMAPGRAPGLTADIRASWSFWDASLRKNDLQQVIQRPVCLNHNPSVLFTE